MVNGGLSSWEIFDHLAVLNKMRRALQYAPTHVLYPQKENRMLVTALVFNLLPRIVGMKDKEKLSVNHWEHPPVKTFPLANPSCHVKNLKHLFNGRNANHYKTTRGQTCLKKKHVYIWVFPKIMVPPNHPF